jgi:hypothetical protein
VKLPWLLLQLLLLQQHLLLLLLLLLQLQGVKMGLMLLLTLMVH